MRSAVKRFGLVAFAAMLLQACGGGSESGSANQGASGVGQTASPTPSVSPTASPTANPTPTATPTSAVTPAPGSISAGAWSDARIWGGMLPRAGDLVVIPAGFEVELDSSTPALGGLTVQGKLTVKQGVDVSITSRYIMVSGAGAQLRAGTQAEPFAGRLQIFLSGTDPLQNIMGHGAKSFTTMSGGTLALYGQQKLAYTRLDATLNAGQATLTVADVPTGWRVGDEISVAPTDFDALEAEKRRITAIDGKLINVNAPFIYKHWGAAPEVHGNLKLDMRAHVGNLSRNILISSIENEERVLPGFDPNSRDAAGLQNGDGKRSGLGRFGGHMMFMAGSAAQLSNVEVTQMGQQGVLARYPVHWHLTGDSSTNNNFIRNSSVHGTFQRGIVLHQANGVEVENNVLFDIPGHGVYFEDGIEHANTVDRNLITLVRYVPRKHRLSVKDPEKDRAEKLSGMWITNPSNFIRDNVVAGVQNGWGFIFGSVADDKIPVIDPKDIFWTANTSYIGFTGNTAYAIGFMANVPDGGDAVFNLGYGPEEAGSCFRFNFPGDYKKSTQMQNLTAFKCANAAFWSTNFIPIRAAVVADSRVAIVNNQGEGGVSELQDSAVVGMTVNNLASRSNLTFGPFPGPVFKEHLEAGPVTFDNVVTSYGFIEGFDGLSPALTSTRANTAGVRMRLPEYVAVKANSSAQFDVTLDRAGGYTGAVDLSFEIPKPSNLATENPYYFLTATPMTIAAGANTGRITINNGAADRAAGNSVVVVKAKGDATVLSTLRVLTATAPKTYSDAATGNNFARLIPGDSPRNPEMSSVVQNAGGGSAVDGDFATSARFEPGTTPWIKLDWDGSYFVSKVVIEWDPAFKPVGNLVLSISEFPVFGADKTLAQVQALPAAIATQFAVPNTGANRIEYTLPAGTVVRQAKLWTTQTQTNEVRVREVQFIAN
jgi:G8 domain/Right handed beta helix region